MAKDQQDYSSFFGGFALGVCAGAIGYYLLGTEEGRKVKARIVREWADAKDQIDTLIEVQPSKVKPVSLRALMITALKELSIISQATKIQVPPPKVVPKSSSKTKRSRSATSPKKASLKFKGA